MKDEVKAVGFGLAGWFGLVALLLITGGIIDYTGIIWDSHIGVKRANVQRQIFEQSKSYTQGQIQQLQSYHHEWTTSDDAGKKLVESTVRHQFADFDIDLITDGELRSFLNTIRSN